jgi:hypothetical protein
MAHLVKLPRVLPDQITDCWVNPDSVCYVQPQVNEPRRCFILTMDGGPELEIDMGALEVVNRIERAGLGTLGDEHEE